MKFIKKSTDFRPFINSGKLVILDHYIKEFVSGKILFLIHFRQENQTFR